MGSITHDSPEELTEMFSKSNRELDADIPHTESSLTDWYPETGDQPKKFPDEIQDSQEELGSDEFLRSLSSSGSRGKSEGLPSSASYLDSPSISLQSFICNRHEEWAQDRVASFEPQLLEDAQLADTPEDNQLPDTDSFSTQATEIIEGGTRLTPRPSPRFILNQRGFFTNGPVHSEDPDNADSSDMDDEATQLSTQPVLDPRRQGLNNSGLDEHDLTDILCILHPNSIAAHAVVTEAVKNSPQHVLQNEGLSGSLDEPGDETFNGEEAHQSRDLALRMSSNLKDPGMGFCFGRNKARCDIVIGSKEELKRFSNMHLRIYINRGGILMLEDTSTNGTIVDGVLLKGKGPEGHSKGRMLTSTSIIQLITSNVEEEIKFIVRFPSRDCFDKGYERRLKDYVAFMAQAERKARAVAQAKANGQFIDLPGGEANPFNGPLFHEDPPQANSTPSGQHLTAGTSAHNTAGMVWDGGARYNVVRMVGKGAFACVYLLADKVDGFGIAAKELEKRKFMKNGILDYKVDNEIKIMKNLKHPNIVQYLDCVDQPEHIYIMMEYVPCGDLAGFMHRVGAMPEYLAKIMSHQVLHALVYLHKQKITHRDIKPDNILVSSETPLHVKLSDFGLSKVIEDPQTFLKTFCGTLLYCAPEVFPGYNLYNTGKAPKRRRISDHNSLRNDPYNSSVDLWSYAACLFQALCTKSPFIGCASDRGQAMLRNIMTKPLDLEPLRQCGVSEEGIDFVAGMLNVKPALRRSEQKCLRHEWLKGIGEGDDEMDMGEEEHELASIAEEADGDDGLDASQLSIHEAPDREIVDSEDEEISEDDEPSYFDVRASKRIRTDGPFGLYTRTNLPADPDVLYPALPQVNASVTQQITTRQPGPNRLFGEIGASALESSGTLGQNIPFALARPLGNVETSSGSSFDPAYEHGDDSLTSTVHNGSDLQGAPHNLYQAQGVTRELDQLGSPSLLGTEFLVGQLNMASTPITTSATSKPKDAVTPVGTTHLEPSSVSTSKRLNDLEDPNDTETTPKRPKIDQRSKDATTTANLEDLFIHHSDFPSNTGGSDSFSKARTAVALTASQANIPALEKSTDESAVSQHNSPDKENINATTSGPILASVGENGLSNGNRAKGHIAGASETQTHSITIDQQGKSADSTQPNTFLRPHAIMGQLDTLPGSLYDITIDINNRVTTWGREPGVQGGKDCHAITFPHSKDTRVPKYAFAILFHCPGMDAALEKGKQWKKMKGTQPVIFTQSSRHILINGVKLRPETEGGWPFGKIYTGDIITIWEADNKNEFLKFRCNFYHGISAEPRPAGQKFIIETTDIGFRKEKAGKVEQSHGQATTSSTSSPTAPSTSA
ncbi:MAG: hypothetical protein M1836_001370 [Candelina mexicana]|nr:MAG: hypothetical protein M1836_001370 [Candelina mexicana]